MSYQSSSCYYRNSLEHRILHNPGLCIPDVRFLPKDSVYFFHPPILELLHEGSFLSLIHCTSVFPGKSSNQKTQTEKYSHFLRITLPPRTGRIYYPSDFNIKVHDHSPVQLQISLWTQTLKKCFSSRQSTLEPSTVIKESSDISLPLNTFQQ